jgi:hypothetical protein
MKVRAFIHLLNNALVALQGFRFKDGWNDLTPEIAKCIESLLPSEFNYQNQNKIVFDTPGFSEEIFRIRKDAETDTRFDFKSAGKVLSITVEGIKPFEEETTLEDYITLFYSDKLKWDKTRTERHIMTLKAEVKDLKHNLRQTKEEMRFPRKFKIHYPKHVNI